MDRAFVELSQVTPGRQERINWSKNKWWTYGWNWLRETVMVTVKMLPFGLEEDRHPRNRFGWLVENYDTTSSGNTENRFWASSPSKDDRICVRLAARSRVRVTIWPFGLNVGCNPPYLAAAGNGITSVLQRQDWWWNDSEPFTASRTAGFGPRRNHGDRHLMEEFKSMIRSGRSIR